MRNPIGTKRFLPAVLAASSILVAALIVVPLIASPHGRSDANPARSSPNPSTSPVPVPSGAITLVQGARLADGIQIGYPHTAVGAVSAAVEYLDAVASTLDPDYAASVVRVAATPAASALPAALAQSTVTLRSDLQLPTSGPLASAVSFETTAEMYQLHGATSASALVLLLTSSTFVNARGGIAQTTGVFPVQMEWVGGDWKLAAIGGSQNYSSLDATPDTQAAVDRGWLGLVATTGGAP